ncbi:MAG: phosphomannomutase/phosphoglucomutase [Actinomycetota bacterium]|nr:phosphomannomutase/phosphoglucomutase [Actinomycetota bacterium]
MNLDAIFKAYDIRGVYPDEIDEEAAHAIGRAFVLFSGASRIGVGHDMRASSEPLSTAFISGAATQGADVVDLGLVSTDLLYYASGHLSMPGAMFTASHNPAEYNGIKMCLSGAAPVGQDTGLADIKELATHGRFPASKKLGTIQRIDLLGAYVDHVLSQADLGDMRPLTVAADAANGMGGLVAPALFERLPVKLVPLYFDLDGTFPNHPADPLQPANLVDLQRAVTESQADIGIAFDGDADRAFFLDERGEPVSGSLTAALVAQSILGKHPGEKAIHNIICSRVVPETIREMGGEPIRSRVGHSFIKELMARTGAIFGAEHSGHYYFRDNYRADSGLIAAVHVLSVLGSRDEPLSKILQPFRRYWNSGEINTDVADQAAAIAAVATAFPEGAQDLTDGLTVEWDDRWFNVRPSNTEPLLRLNVEARDAQVGEVLRDRVLGIFR